MPELNRSKKLFSVLIKAEDTNLTSQEVFDVIDKILREHKMQLRHVHKVFTDDTTKCVELCKCQYCDSPADGKWHNIPLCKICALEVM